mgnify:CR=1 FL=1|tara:strand:+ start:1523 stop:1780 length:258 start_codon:yes stop_codon:yes gene_type:complete
MKIKLKKEVLKSGGLPSSGSHQGFTKNDWFSLNNGKIVDVDKIPEKSKNKVEEAEVKQSKNKTKKVKVAVPNPSSIKKQEVTNGK